MDNLEELHDKPSKQVSEPTDIPYKAHVKPKEPDNHNSELFILGVLRVGAGVPVSKYVV